MPFTKFGLLDPLVQGILAAGYAVPTEIQTQAIPAAVEGEDIFGCAQTGTGKTAAFVLPMLHRIYGQSSAKHKQIKSLILTPTRELAVQVEKAGSVYGRFLNVRALSVYGGVSIEKQIKTLKSGVDVVIATPGRLLDLMNRKAISLGHVEVLVIDEADRMFDMGFIADIRKIIQADPTERQTMLFSATLSKEVRDLTADIQKQPRMIQIGAPRNPAETVTQHFYPVTKEQKLPLLLHMLEYQEMDSVLVFSRTRHGADKICKKLKNWDVTAVSIHSGRSQNQRLAALDGFKRGRFQVMVATDIAARGLNVEGISHVINFDVPAFAEDYIHRIGRTGRASATGDAVTFVSSDEMQNLKRIEKFINRKFEMKACQGFNYDKSLELRKPAKTPSSEKPTARPEAKGTNSPGREKSGGRFKSKDGKPRKNFGASDRPEKQNTKTGFRKNKKKTSRRFAGKRG
jgi:ATP-dependent RNA helicase RhlE